MRLPTVAPTARLALRADGSAKIVLAGDSQPVSAGSVDVGGRCSLVALGGSGVLIGSKGLVSEYSVPSALFLCHACKPGAWPQLR